MKTTNNTQTVNSLLESISTNPLVNRITADNDYQLIIKAARFLSKYHELNHTLDKITSWILDNTDNVNLTEAVAILDSKERAVEKNAEHNLTVIQNFILNFTGRSEFNADEKAKELYDAAAQYIQEDHVDGYQA
jgi:hypothetical protein